ncbi:hypothetical protein LJR130_003838 [Variovorax sp. LjRoot130]|uniref:LysM peptidoglycan-binding domain-containing protein n=1 Tax=Variovorax sp. LjRoot130 TaxID=3342261 RepID=UPI003ED07419
MTYQPNNTPEPLASNGPMHPALLPIVVAIANFHEAVWEAAKASRVTPDEAGAAQAKALIDVIGAALSPSAPAAPTEPPSLTREHRHLIRCAIALLMQGGLIQVAGQSRSMVAHQLQVMLAASWPDEQAAPRALPTHTTQPAESLMGIALRQLKDESRWTEIRDLNASNFPDMGPHDYYPVGTVLKLPTERAKGTGAPKFPTMLRKMWSGPEVQVWIDEHWRPPTATALPELDSLETGERDAH